MSYTAPAPAMVASLTGAMYSKVCLCVCVCVMVVVVVVVVGGGDKPETAVK